MDKSTHINRSGFPLQIGLAHAIDSSQKEHGWRVLHQEHGWKHAHTDESGFIDLVVENQPSTVILNIECKRPQDATWQFLLPAPKNKHRRRCKFWATYGGNSRLTHFDWVDLTIEPTSYESTFCVVAGQDAKSRPMLERIAATVVESTEALAQEEAALLKNQRVDHLRTYINVIVTTAKLEVCKFDPNQIDLETGTIGDAEYEDIPYIRFRKQLSALPKPLGAMEWNEGLRSVTEAKENTVLVVQATKVIQLLKELEIDHRISNVVHANRSFLPKMLC